MDASDVDARNPGLVQLFPRALNEAPKTFAVRDSVVVGRSRQADVRLEEAEVSRCHAELKTGRGGIFLRDLGSRHGTFVNGRSVSPEGTLVEYGAIVRVGETLLLVAEDIFHYARPPRRIAGSFLGLQQDVIAGPTLAEVWETASRVAPLKHPILVLGESGSGKEAIARFVHAVREKPGPFVAVNLAAIPDGLFESELFGHVRGAFTGAVSGSPGAFREANEGVLFLDEVGDLKPELQAKLLRVLDQESVRPVGASHDVEVNVRVVAATSLDLEEKCTQGSFRRDLYYRLAGVVIQVPPLRQRLDEIVLFTMSVLKREKAELGITGRAMEALLLSPWEGNVRELQHSVIQGIVRALARGDDRIELEDLPSMPRNVPRSEQGEWTVERLRTAMLESAGNASTAAKSLGVSRATLYNLFKRHHLDPQSLRSR